MNKFLKCWRIGMFPVVLLTLLLTMAVQPMRAPSAPLEEIQQGSDRRSRQMTRFAEMNPAEQLGWLMTHGRLAGAAGEVINFPLARSIYTEQYIDPLLRDNVTVNGTGIDLQATPYVQFDHFMFIVEIGATDIVVDFEVQDSADNMSFATLKDADAADVDITQITATDDNKHVIVEVTTKAYTVRRYIRGQLIVGDGTAGADSAVFLLAYGFEGETPTPAATDRLELVVPASAT